MCARDSRLDPLLPQSAKRVRARVTPNAPLEPPQGMKKPRAGRGFFGAPEGIRTPGLLIRSQTLYPAELQVHPVTPEFLAERERFELSVPLEYAVLAGLWFKPLTHLSRRASFDDLPYLLTYFLTLTYPSESWRRVRDLNPRWSSPHCSFQDCCHQPLGQPSLREPQMPTWEPQMRRRV